jgi:FkbM family methyltransferase
MNSLLSFLYRSKEKVLPNIELKKIPPFGWLRSRIRRRMRREFVEIEGHKIFLDPNDALDLSINPGYEPELTGLIQRQTKPGNVAVDIGANIGYYTLILARCVGPQGRVFAFEPDPVNFALLKKNVETNGYANVVLVNKALSDKAASAKLFLATDNLGDHRIFDPGDGRRSIPIETVALDDFMADPPVSVDVIKMDVQGAEYRALRGMRSVLARSKSLTLFSEFWPYGLFKAGDDPEAFLALLRDLGFTIYDSSSPQAPLAPNRLDALLRKAQVNNPRHIDLMSKRI